MKKLLSMILLASVLPLCATACGDDSSTEGNTHFDDVETIIITGIPDSQSSTLKKQYTLLGDYIAKKTGKKVEMKQVKDYGGAVTALTSGKAHLAWLGGKTAVDSEDAAPDDIEFIALRDIDYKFYTYFIANRDRMDELGLKEGMSLEEFTAAIKQNGKKMKFTFGSTGSTSGHMMPRYFLQMKGGIDPEKDFDKRTFSGGHDTTITHVFDGTADVGAVNFTNWDKKDDATKAQTPIVYKTEPYIDYVLVGRKDMGTDLMKKVKEAMLAIDGKDADEEVQAMEQNLLKEFGNAKKFMEADSKDWDPIREVMKKVKALGPLQ